MSKLDGKLKLGEYTLTLNVNALCDLEEALGVDDVNEVLAKLAMLQEKPSLRTLRTIFAVALRQDHPEVTERQAGDLLSDVGLEVASEVLGKAIALAFPDPSEDEGKAKPAGAGKNS
jgi:hypothetical protein